jgi:hypothetical protein
MKAKIGSVEVEGTPQEISQLLWSMGVHEVAELRAKTPRAGGDKGTVSQDVAFRMLKRRPLSETQKALFSLLRANHPEWTSAKALQKATKYRPNQLAGLLGALGKRVSSTEGYVPGSILLDYRWDYDDDCYYYRLPDDVKAAVERAGL